MSQSTLDRIWRRLRERYDADDCGCSGAETEETATESSCCGSTDY